MCALLDCTGEFFYGVRHRRVYLCSIADVPFFSCGGYYLRYCAACGVTATGAWHFSLFAMARFVASNDTQDRRVGVPRCAPVPDKVCSRLNFTVDWLASRLDPLFVAAVSTESYVLSRWRSRIYVFLWCGSERRRRPSIPSFVPYFWHV